MEKQIALTNKSQDKKKKLILLVLAIVYLVSPFDFIPEFLATIIGPFVYSDDLLVIIGSILPYVLDFLKNRKREE